MTDQMGKIKNKIALGLALICLLGSCDANFEQINTNPIEPTSLDSEYLFSNAQRTSALNTITYQAPIVQQVQVPYSGNPAGGNLNLINETNIALIYNDLYTGPIRNLTDAIDKIKENPDRINLYNMSRIWRAYCFQFLVDTYGDVPYFEAGNGFLKSNYLPKYDPSEVIYDDILLIYEEATDALDPSADIVKGDLFYEGNISKWKKLGNSLLLRTGMRYTKIDEEKAKSIVMKAVDPLRGGVMESNNDNAFVPFTHIFPHPLSILLAGNERHNYYAGAPFVEFLKEHNDPRMKYIVVKYQNPQGSIEEIGHENTDPIDQKGFPFGYDENTITNAPDYPGKIGAAFAYSQFNRRTILSFDRPEFIVTYAQTSLLMAEAVLRGFITGNAAELYNIGIRAHMSQMEAYSGRDVKIQIPSEVVEAYLNQPQVVYHPSNALGKINEQYWVASFMQFQEAWSNFRRSGYPNLEPANYPGQDPSVNDTGAGFIRRLTYPNRELSVNTKNVEEAIQRMGGNTLGNPIFWDRIN